MVPLVPTFPPMVTLAPIVPLVKFPMVPLGESRTHAVQGIWPLLPGHAIITYEALAETMAYEVSV